MTDTDVALLLYYKPCPYDRHDLYLSSFPSATPRLHFGTHILKNAPRVKRVILRSKRDLLVLTYLLQPCIRY